MFCSMTLGDAEKRGFILAEARNVVYDKTHVTSIATGPAGHTRFIYRLHVLGEISQLPRRCPRVFAPH